MRSPGSVESGTNDVPLRRYVGAYPKLYRARVRDALAHRQPMEWLQYGRDMISWPQVEDKPRLRIEYLLS